MELNAEVVMITIEDASGNALKSFPMNFWVMLEMMRIHGMQRWEQTAPPPGQHGDKGGVWMENSQQARLQYVLKLIGQPPHVDRRYSILADATRRPHTHESSVTRARPAQPLALNDRWYLDGCLNLSQKLQVVDALKHMGCSPRFIEMARRFVAGTPMDGISIQ